MSEQSMYVSKDGAGVMRVGHTRVALDSIVAGFHLGHSPETIQQQFPALTLEAVYGAIAWYLAHSQEAEDYLRTQANVWNNWREQIGQRSSPVIERLRALKQAQTSSTG